MERLAIVTIEFTKKSYNTTTIVYCLIFDMINILWLQSAFNPPKQFFSFLACYLKTYQCIVRYLKVK